MDAGGNFLEDTTTGLLGGKPYFRKGMPGYDPIGKRYEWTTVDNQTPIRMSYAGRAGSGVTLTDLQGEFMDPGVTGERNVGKTIAMRTSMRIDGPDHHVFELYFTPPGGAELLADRMVFDRIR